MTQVYVGIGSNIDRINNVKGGILALKQQFGKVIVSPVYECRPFGFEGDNFYNLVVGFETNSDVEKLHSELRRIEFQFGRKRNEPRFSSRTLDIDLLLYGDLVSKKRGIPRHDIIKYDFVLKPLADIAPHWRHPKTGAVITSMWAIFDKSKSALTTVTLNLND